MGKIYQGILGGFLNKVGPVIGTSWKGRNVMRAMPTSVANPRTAAQVAQRNIFKAWVTLASLFLSNLIVPFVNRLAGSISGFNYFVKNNILANSAAPAVGSQFILTKGKLINPANAQFTLSANQFSCFASNQPTDAYGLPTDRFYFFLFQMSADFSTIISDYSDSVLRSDFSPGGLGFNMSVTSGNVALGFGFWVSADGTRASNNLYFSQAIS